MKHLFVNLDAALFDLDGTLVETNIDFSLMKREMIHLAVDYELAESDVAGLDILAIVDRMTDHARERHGEDLAAVAREEAFAILEEIELRHSADSREIVPARDLVETLQNRDVKVGVVTRNCRAAAEESLALAGIELDVIICREYGGKMKPCPDQLLAALEALGAHPMASVMIGDHLIDVNAGKAAGMRTIGLLTQGRAPGYFDEVGPDAVAGNLEEILSAVIDCHS